MLEVGREDVQGDRPPRGHAHRWFRRRDRGDNHRGGVRESRRAGEADRRTRHAGAVLARRSRRRSSRRSRTSSQASGTWPRTRNEMATQTAVDVVMPQMGVSVSEGTITKWLKQPGETIAADESLLEISTDKVDTEVPSPATRRAPEDPRPGRRDGRGRHGARRDRARGRPRPRPPRLRPRLPPPRHRRPPSPRPRPHLPRRPTRRPRSRPRRSPRLRPRPLAAAPDGTARRHSSPRSSRGSRPSTASTSARFPAPAAAAA